MLLSSKPHKTTDNNWKLVRKDGVPTLFWWDMVQPCIKVGLIPGLLSTEWNLWTLANKLVKAEMSLPMLSGNPLSAEGNHRVSTVVCYPGRNHELYWFTVGFNQRCSGVSHTALPVFFGIVGLIRIRVTVGCSWNHSPFFFFVKQKNNIQRGHWNMIKFILGYNTVAGKGSQTGTPAWYWWYVGLVCFLEKKITSERLEFWLGGAKATEEEKRKFGKEL